VSVNRHVVSNPEQQPIGEAAFPEIVQKSSSGKSLGCVVGVPSLWPRPGGVLQQHGLGVLRPDERKHSQTLAHLSLPIRLITSLAPTTHLQHEWSQPGQVDQKTAAPVVGFRVEG